MQTASFQTLSDAELWGLCRVGDRDAFAVIVERHQSLLCSLAYSGCGDLALAEDVAQDAFVAAWRQSTALKEPERVKGWLCGIVRNLILCARRSHARTPTPLATLAADEHASDEMGPEELAISNEEAAILWRSLERIPEPYRETLVLYYREGRSVSQVAQGLEISEEAVKQRLARGRAMLRTELQDVVESVLTRTRPSRAFTWGVLAALPALSAPSTAAAALMGSGAMLKAGPPAKGVAFAWSLTPWIAPFLGLFLGMMGAQAASLSAESKEEAAHVRRASRWIAFYAWCMSLLLAAALLSIPKLLVVTPLGIWLGVAFWTAALLGGIMWQSQRLDESVCRIRLRKDNETLDHASQRIGKSPALGFWSSGFLHWQSKRTFFGLPWICVRMGGKATPRIAVAARGWIAIGDIAVSPLLAMGGIAIAPCALGGITVGIASLSFWGIALGILAFGSVAVGWVAIGFASLGWHAAIGCTAVARDYAWGPQASAAEANTQAAIQHLTQHPLYPCVALLVAFVHFAALLIVLASIVWVCGRCITGRRGGKKDGQG